MPGMSVQEIQQGLAEGHRLYASTIPSPGSIDGVWGPNTQRSLDAFLSPSGYNFPTVTYVRLASGQLMFSGAQAESAMSRLATWASSYRSRTRSTSTTQVTTRPATTSTPTITPSLPVASAALAVPARASMTPYVLLGVGGALLVGAIIYFRRS